MNEGNWGQPRDLRQIRVSADFEHDLISERVRAGMARAKRQGVKFGSRPTLFPNDRHT